LEPQTYRPGVQADLPQITELLTRAGLPLAGMEKHVKDFVLAFRDGSLVGCAAVEHYGSTALLRSVAVAEQERNHGLGQELVRQTLDSLRAEGLEKVVLLTTTAADYFQRFGFCVIQRADAPRAVQESVEFQYACPASATVMQIDLLARELSSAAKGL
jgi:amino-acid N-acetyltransferase